MLFRKLRLDWKYGLSELVIVVTGVLIALAADGWADSRADRALETQYIFGLVRDLQSDTAQIREAITLSEKRARSARDVLAAINGDSNLAPNELAIAVEESRVCAPRIDPVRVLISAKILGLDSLRFQVGQWWPIAHARVSP